MVIRLDVPTKAPKTRRGLLRVIEAFPQTQGAASVQFYGTMANTHVAIRSMLRKLGKDGQRLHLTYEAGPLGYNLYRLATKLCHRCDVVAPSLIPRKAGDKIKMDRHDAMTLAQLLRAGQLTEVWVPDEAHEAMRDLVRMRAQAMKDLRKTRHRQQPRAHVPRRSAWTSRHPARVTKIIRDSLEGLPEPIRAIAWKAQVRLSARYRKLMAAGSLHRKRSSHCSGTRRLHPGHRPARRAESLGCGRAESHLTRTGINAQWSAARRWVADAANAVYGFMRDAP